MMRMPARGVCTHSRFCYTRRMNKSAPLLLSASLAILPLAGCVIDDADSPGYYYSDGSSGTYRARPYEERYASGGYGYRRDRDDWDDGYERGYRDARRDERGRRRDERDDRDGKRHSGHADRPGEFSAGGNAKEYAFGAGHRRCTITVTEGSVGFRTIVVRSGGAKKPHAFNTTLQKGQSLDVPIDRDATGLRISDTGRGRYRVTVR